MSDPAIVALVAVGWPVLAALATAAVCAWTSTRNRQVPREAGR
ncbi:hypothetical protein ACFCZ3_20165 [Cellulosimicrobium cellulans]